MSSTPNISSKPNRRYKAFISYSHKDVAVARWLQRELEQYRFPRSLVGHQTRHTTITRKLGIVFRDREDLVAGPSITSAIDAAVTASETLIVLCSAASAMSKEVNREIELFRQLGRSDRILPVIVDESADYALHSVFPPALRAQPTEGQSVHSPLEIVPTAADMRTDRDGRRLAKLKLIAGIVDLPLHEMTQREDQAERRQRRIWASAATAMGLLASVAGWQWYEADKHARLAGENLDLAERRLASAVEIGSDFGHKIRTESDRLEIRSSQALELLKIVHQAIVSLSKQNPHNLALREQAAQLRLDHCDHYMRLGRYDDWGDSAREAEKLFTELAHLQPGNSKIQERLGKATYQIALSYQQRGYIEESQQYFIKTRDIRKRLVADNPNAPDVIELKRGISAAYLMLGEGYRLQGSFRKALDMIETTIALRRDLADPSRNATIEPDRKRDLANALAEQGLTYMFLGDLDEGEALFKEAFQIRSDLHQSHPNRNEYLRRLAWSTSWLAQVALARGHTKTALEQHAQAVRMISTVAASDRNNVIFANDVAWLQGYRGIAQMAAGRIGEGLDDFERAAHQTSEIGGKPADEMDNMWPRRNAAYWHFHAATAMAAKGDPEAAIRRYDDAIKLLETVANTDTTNLTWRAELASNLIGKAKLLSARGAEREKLNLLERGRRLIEPLSRVDLPNFAWKHWKFDIDTMITEHIAAPQDRSPSPQSLQ